MDIPETLNQKSCEPESESIKPKPPNPISSGDILDLNTWKGFFNLTGGSLFYCLSAVFVAYGIVKVMGPILSDSDSLLSALPCILTLHIYEIALLGVLILIVSRKVVDDAISVVILMSLFLVGTSIAQGSVADRDITISFFVGFFGITVAIGKFYAMRRFALIPFGVQSVLGLGVIISCNYLGPTLMALLISNDPTSEMGRRNLWLFLWLTILTGTAFVITEAMKTNHKQQIKQHEPTPFLQTHLMVYVFALIIVIASGVHQYSMAFTFALERVLGDFVPVIAVAVLLMLQILRNLGKRFGYTEIFISCAPLAAMLLAINEKAVLSSGQLGPGLLCYPPVTLALSGLAIAVVAIYHRWYRLLAAVFLYGLGVILTVGFSPEHPYDLNILACIGTLAVALLVYGIIIRNQFSYIAGIVVLCFELAQLDAFSVFVKNLNLTETGSLAGVCGLGFMAFYLLFGHRLHKALQIVGALCLAGFVYDYLPDYIHWRYIIALLATGCLMVLLWFRKKDILNMAILFIPFLIKVYIMAKRLAHWRFVLIGFLLLAAGTIASLFKRPTRSRICPVKPEKRGDTSP
jgi:hypothetical protein